MESFTLVIFGATGNLSQIKLIPTLYDLVAAKAINVPFTVVGIGRKNLSTAGFRSFVSESLRLPNRHHQHDIDPKIEKDLLSQLEYISIDTEQDDFGSLSSLLATLPSGGNRIYYLATYPSLYQGIFAKLDSSGLNSQDRGWVRVMIEKPIGYDLKSAKKLNQLLGSYYQEDQIFRLDHYLGKETLQNIFTFRFGGGIFEPLMNNQYIDHIEVTASEDFGIGNRGGYYDVSGALRDVGQNHLLQMLALTLMDAPDQYSNEAITKERVKLIRSLIPEPNSIVFGQYQGYKTEPNIDQSSSTETYFAFRTHSTNTRYQGIPIYVRAGKYLARTATEVAIFFKDTGPRIFNHLEGGNTPNVLIYRVQPNEGIVMRIMTKVPGHQLKLEESYMQFCYKQDGVELPDAYERLIVDALAGDQTFFNDAPEIESQWEFIDPLIKVKANSKLHIYPRGSWGPVESNDLTPWLEPSTVFCTL